MLRQVRVSCQVPGHVPGAHPSRSKPNIHLVSVSHRGIYCKAHLSYYIECATIGMPILSKTTIHVNALRYTAPFPGIFLYFYTHSHATRFNYSVVSCRLSFVLRPSSLVGNPNRRPVQCPRSA